MGILTLPFGLVLANVLLQSILWCHFGEDIFAGIFNVHISTDSTQIGHDSVLNRLWIGVRSADICPIHNWSWTDKSSIIGGRIETDTTRTLPDITDTTPTYNRQTTYDLSERDLWKILRFRPCNVFLFFTGPKNTMKIKGFLKVVCYLQA